VHSHRRLALFGAVRDSECVHLSFLSMHLTGTMLLIIDLVFLVVIGFLLDGCVLCS
jgi:hypothetical protein